MAATSGKEGTAKWDGTEVTEMMSWTFTDISENKDYHSNDSGTARKRVAGVKDSNGSFVCNDLPAGTAGAGAELIMYDDVNIFTVTAIIDSVQPNCDIHTGDITTYTVNWSGNGAVVNTVGSAP